MARDTRLKDLTQLLTLVDGTMQTVLPRMAEASLLKRQTGSGQVQWCLHTPFDVEKYVPDRIEVTPDAGGEHDERAVLERAGCTTWTAATPSSRCSTPSRSTEAVTSAACETTAGTKSRKSDRWQIEVFFRTFKYLLGCRHLLSRHPDGIKIQTYCAIIACLAWIIHVEIEA